MEEMTPQHWSYELIKSIAIQEPSTPTFINELKTMFINDIGSPRRYECIRTMADLIDCLERRYAINENNVEPLRILCNKELEEVIEKYSAGNMLKVEEGINQYHDIRIANEVSNKLSINGHNAETSNNYNIPLHGIDTATGLRNNASLTTNANTNISYNPIALSEEKRAAIYKMLSQHLGTHWRSFGRELGMREGALDEIELQCPRELSTRVYKVMKAFEEDDCHDPKMNLRIIKEALERARRKDLRRKVDDIMSH